MHFQGKCIIIVLLLLKISIYNALENHGLDICPDHGTDGFDRYAALAVTARNIQILGNIIQKKELRRQKRHKKHRLAA